MALASASIRMVGKKNPKVTVARVCVPRMSASCFLPLGGFLRSAGGYAGAHVLKSRLTLCDTMFCSLPGSSELWIF